MIRIINNLKNDKKGFTLTELLVTMTILLIALTLSVQLLGTIWQNYLIVEYRYVIQNEVEYVATCFQKDAHLEAFETADRADLYYVDFGDVASGGVQTVSAISNAVPEFSSFDYDTETHSIKINVDTTQSNRIMEYCIYFLTFDDHFYIIRYDDLLDIDSETNAVTIKGVTDEIMPLVSSLKLIDDESADNHVKVEFNVATNAREYDTTTHNESSTVAPTKYLNNSVTCTVRGTLQNKAWSFVKNTTSLDTTVTMLNMDEARVNYSGGELSNSSVAGWSVGSLTGYPNSTEINDAGVASPTESANIVRYHSVNTPADITTAATQDNGFNLNVDMPVCLFMASIGSNSGPVIETLRDFRDNVLRGNELGELIIKKYYDWSPELVKFANNHIWFKQAVRTFAESFTAVASIVSG